MKIYSLNGRYWHYKQGLEKNISRKNLQSKVLIKTMPNGVQVWDAELKTAQPGHYSRPYK